MQIQTTVRYHFTHSRIAIIKKQIITSAEENAEKLKPLQIATKNIT